MNAQIKLVLDTYRQNRIAPVFSMVGDYGAREIRAIITCDGDPHAVPVTAEVTINAKRPDGQKKRFSGAANGDGSVTVPITQWMLELRGGVECTISAIGIGTKLTTTPITLTVLQTATGEDISPDDPEYDLLAQVLAGEAERVEAEKTRVVNEQTRVDAEAVRAENEAKREANEDVRRTNEAARVNAEQNRADTFAGWVGDMGQLGNFNARLTNVESAIYGDLAREVVDDSVARVKDVPAAAKPYARVDMIGGMTYRVNVGTEEAPEYVLRSAKVESVESVGVNLFDGDEVINVDGYKQIKLPKPLPPGTYYVSAMVSSTDTDTASTRLAFVSGSNNYYVIFYRQKEIETKTIDIPDTVTSVRLLSGYSTSASEGDTSVWTKLQIERNGFTDYKLYQAHTLPIPAEVKALPGYGEGNPDNINEYNAIKWQEDGKRVYSHKGNIADGAWVALDSEEITDISDILPADNYIGVEGGGTLTMVNEYGYDVPSEVVFVTKEVTE